jgi:hypothetical protein
MVWEFSRRFNLANGLEFEFAKKLTSRTFRISCTLLVIIDMVPSLSQATLSAIKTSRYVDSGIIPWKYNQPGMTFFSVSGLKAPDIGKNAHDAAISLHLLP